MAADKGQLRICVQRGGFAVWGTAGRDPAWPFFCHQRGAPGVHNVLTDSACLSVTCLEQAAAVWRGPHPARPLNTCLGLSARGICWCFAKPSSMCLSPSEINGGSISALKFSRRERAVLLPGSEPVTGSQRSYISAGSMLAAGSIHLYNPGT